MGWWKKILLYSFATAFVLYLRCRLSTLQELQNIKFWTRHDEASDKSGTISDFNKPIYRLGRLFSELRRNENSFEQFTQAVLLITVIFLRFTHTATHKFPKALFSGGSVHFIVISALWSFFSMVFGYLHCVVLTKGNILPPKGKIILTIFAILSLIARLSSVILFFAPGTNAIKLVLPLQLTYSGRVIIHTSTRLIQISTRLKNTHYSGKDH